MAAVRCYESQFDGRDPGGRDLPERRAAVRHRHASRGDYGSLIRTRYGEPFFTTEMMRVDDVGVARGGDVLSDAPRADDAEVTYGSYLALDELLDAAAPALRARAPRRAAVHRRAPGERAVVQGDPPRARCADRRARARRGGVRALPHGAHQRADAHRLGAALRARDTAAAALRRIPRLPRHARADRRACSSAPSRPRRGCAMPHFMHVLAEHGEIPPLVQRALARPTLQELFLALLRTRGVELESLYVGARPTTLFFLAEALLEYEQQFGLWRFQHVQLVERVLGPLTGGTGGTLGAKYLSRTIDQKFFPELWAVRAQVLRRAGIARALRRLRRRARRHAGVARRRAVRMRMDRAHRRRREREPVEHLGEPARRHARRRAAPRARRLAGQRRAAARRVPRATRSCSTSARHAGGPARRSPRTIARLAGVERLLLRTGRTIADGAFPQRGRCWRWRRAAALAARGLRLLGVDAPSVDERESRRSTSTTHCSAAARTCSRTSTCARFPRGGTSSSRRHSVSSGWTPRPCVRCCVAT